MATKPITYFAQNAAINALTKKYGAMLQGLDRTEKMAMLAICTRVLYFGQPEMLEHFANEDFSIEDEIAPGEYEAQSNEFFDAVTSLDGSTEDEILGFCQGLIDSLK
jgi:hypothetical protein